MTQKTVLLLSLCFTLFQACDPCKPDTFTVTEKTKQFFLPTANGSQYIYENVADSTDLDTLTVVGSRNGLDFQFVESRCDGDYFEYFKYALISNRHDTLNIGLGTNPNVDNYSLRGKFHNLNLSCYYWLKKTSEQFENYSKDDFETLSTYSIKNKTYTEVIKITFNQFKPYNGEAPVYYHSKNIGLVQFKAPDQNGQNLKTYYLKARIKK